MAESIPLKHAIADSLKSPGTWFLLGNAVLNAQTDIAITFGYAALFVTQRAASQRWTGAVKTPVAKFILGPQGPLFLNAVMTGLAGALTLTYGSPILAAACLSFSMANLIQSLVYSGSIKFNPAKSSTFAKNSLLASCEIGILYGLSKVAENAGFDSSISQAMVLPGVLFALVRTFRPKALPASLAYVDMMTVAVVTGTEAASSSNHANAISRVLALGGFIGLAGTRAKFDREDAQRSAAMPSFFGRPPLSL